MDERIIINVKTINEKDYLEQLDNGFIDLAICTTRSNQTKILVNGKLWREELCICASDKHPLTIKDEVFLAELSAYEAVFPEEGGYIREKAEALFAKHHLPLAVTLEAGTIFSVKNIVFSGNYWSVVHKRVLDESHLKITKVPDIKLDIKFNWYCLNSRVQERTIEQTINHINNWIICNEVTQLNEHSPSFIMKTKKASNFLNIFSLSIKTRNLQHVLEAFDDITFLLDYLEALLRS
ncbi:LysR family transporter transcriptional regulator [Legionella sainthelensi]|uniref:LysR family transporter transcriptional regulator n=1 Tax=Legionella sainthelensi TaxID=28087 RepID=A0A0W0YS50_9GAMM|nr:LysR family transporter transcriptional regulator [Legionella sainthelensi]VEH35937.1 transcriptional regulator [Legionella sainthelensi]